MEFTKKVPMWRVGDTGRHPLLTNLIKQAVNYHNRLVHMTMAGSEALVCRAFAEQTNQNLPWLKNLKELECRLTHSTVTTTSMQPMNAIIMRDRAQNIFEHAWRLEVYRHSVKTPVLLTN